MTFGARRVWWMIWLFSENSSPLYGGGKLASWYSKKRNIDSEFRYVDVQVGVWV
jgi:hypothetical protein